MPSGLKNFLNPTPGRPNNGARLSSTRPNNSHVCKGTPAPIPPTYGLNPALGAALFGSLSITFASSGSYADRQDDDTCIRVDGRTVWDPRRNVSWYATGTIALSPQIAGILNGSIVEVLAFDGWGGGWTTKPWSASVIWSDGAVSLYSGGSLASGLSITDTGSNPPRYFTTGPHFLTYIPNGSFIAIRP